MAANKILSKPEAFYADFERSANADKKTTHYCPGCGHGHVHKIMAEALRDFEVADRAVLVSPVGCSVFAYYYFDVGNIQAAHGRAPAVATGIKRTHPHSIVMSYQGDGDLAAIGTSEIIHAANRGEHITVIFINNAIYGMTGGQMAPTTLIEQKSSTSPLGRNADNEGYPIRVAELLNSLQAPVFIERTSLHTPQHINRTRRAIRRALQAQIEGKGFTFVEVLSPCPSGWKINPVDSMKWIEEHMLQVFPLGNLRDRVDDAPTRERIHLEMTADMILRKLDLQQPETKAPARTQVEERFRDPQILAAGFGGQGIMLLGVAVAEAGMREGYQSSWIPAYGPEMRGGTANCSVRISEKEIGSPMVHTPDILLAFNRPSLEKFEATARPGGVIFYDSSLIDITPTRTDCDIVPIPFTKLADDLGNTRIANMVAFGALVGYTNLLNLETCIEALGTVVKRKALVDLNRTAVLKGFEVGKEMRRERNR
ncbi:MAG: 2-oxoacid:acceptor oxidoreductase family protein [Prosthecobacter sp.]|jgi:2-oxoisovalerate ferredoxin oxidoreductase beta subunit|nr:2-oxoacid:acceptor oxidoreductase family protein [Prosthecobacter sp.]